ncbi:hypothetical protein J2W98_005754 [Paenibacillus peoriae]|uniref:Uncharacterized protein n=1 Tax=Paenibacillus peoriae TaxID=59893 RepID=A0ABU1QP62_9BACL|nr:hypothetical protein [Paenibacillus peoriae]
MIRTEALWSTWFSLSTMIEVRVTEPERSDGDS